MSLANWMMVACGLSAIALGAISLVQPLSLGAIRSNQATAEMIRRSDNARRYWGLIQVRMIQVMVMMIVVNLAGSRFWV